MIWKKLEIATTPKKYAAGSLAACGLITVSAALITTRHASADPGAPGHTRIVDIQPSSYHVSKKITLGGEGGWDYLSFDPDTNRLYISRSTYVSVVDVKKGKEIGTIPDTQGVHGIAIASGLGRGFTSNGRDNSVTIFDLKTRAVIKRVSVGKNPDAIIFDPATKRVFTMNGSSNDATAIDATTGEVAGTIALGGRPEFAVSDEKGEVFVNLEDKSEIVALDAQALTVKNHWSLAPGDGPSGLAIDRDHRRLFATCSNEKMAIINADTGAMIASPTIGKGPDAGAFDPDTGLAISSNGQDGTLTLIKEKDPDTYEVAATVPTEPGARTMALDTKNHRIFLVTAKRAGPPPAEGAPRQRPSFVPGSFTLLIVSPK